METRPPDPDTKDHRHAVALFRYGLIADIAALDPRPRGLYALLAKKAEQDVVIPGSLRRRVAVETLRGWLRDYRVGGFDALLPKPRKDQGSARLLPSLVVDLLCQLKDDDRSLTVPRPHQARAQHEARPRHGRDRSAALHRPPPARPTRPHGQEAGHPDVEGSPPLRARRSR